MRISDWSSDVCSSDLAGDRAACARTIAHRHVETVAARHWRDIVAAHIGLGGKAIGDDAPVADARDDRLHFRMVEAQNGRAVKGHILHELDKGVLRSEEHTSELQSLMRISYAVFCLKKKTKKL